MNTSLPQRFLLRALPVAMLLVIGAWQAPVFAASTCTQGSTCITVDGKNGGAMSTEQARQSQEQWNDTRTLRHKINKEAEKEFDKASRAIDDEERCDNSANFNAYWEPSMRKCLDRNTGNPITP